MFGCSQLVPPGVTADSEVIPEFCVLTQISKAVAKSSCGKFWEDETC